MVSKASARHQEQVPRKQGLKPGRKSIEKGYQKIIKSKFHENKDWNIDNGTLLSSITHTSRASSTKTRIETAVRVLGTGHATAHQEQVPRKQGLKLEHRVTILEGVAHQEQVPRKQGLKLLTPGKGRETSHSSRASSTKTRIETTVPNLPLFASSTSRASSTKTRIETQASWRCDIHRILHQEQVPRKQGLKLHLCPWIEAQHRHQEQVPRKQGLKLFPGVPHRQSVSSSRASSTKTRIETSCLHRSSPPCLPIKSKFHENKDWNTTSGTI